MKVVYWNLDAQGRLEFIRYLLHHAGADYTLEKLKEDKNDEIFDWYLNKKKALGSTKNPIINLPYIVTDEDEFITETVAIMMYLAEILGYHGKNLTEKTRINQIVLKVNDFRADVKEHIVFCPKSSEKKIKFAKMGVINYMNQFENCFKIWNCKYLCSDNISVADIMAFQILDIVIKWMPSLFSNFSNLKNWYETMLNDPKIHEHREKIKHLPGWPHLIDRFENSNVEDKNTPVYKFLEKFVKETVQYWGTDKTGMEPEF